MLTRSGSQASGAVVFRKPRPGDMPYYEMPDNALSHGASLGNRHIWVTTKATGAIERVFCNSAGVNLLGSMVVTYALPTNVLITSSPEPECLEDGQESYVLVAQDGVGTVRIYPFGQAHIFELSGELHVEETLLVPKLPDGDPPVVLQNIEVTNLSDADVSLMITIYAGLRGDLGEDLAVEFDDELGALMVHNQSRPECARMVGAQGCGLAYRTTHDISEGYAGAYARKLSDEPSGSPGPIGQLQVDLPVEAGQTASVTLVAAATSGGVHATREAFRHIRSFAALHKATVGSLTRGSSFSMVETPDPIINQGVFWSKINMLRVMADYPEGAAFTNEPGKSTNVVARDVAWFVYGSDFVAPEFSRQLLLKLAEKQYSTGKIPEYYNAVDGRVEDYNISLNDDTPLFVLACCHHYSATRDAGFLAAVYHRAKSATDYILSQRRDDGLVISTAEGTEVHGIASWRNVIPDYQINGAITEINAECYGALLSFAWLARAVGDPDAGSYERAAEDLKIAINYLLLNRDTGLYYLNIDSDGVVHTDVTADEVFPVLFGVAPPGVEHTIISRLRADDFLTSAGLRTVSRNSPDYEPTRLVGLRGGVWPGVAFWYAFAAAKSNPEFMVDALHASYLQYLSDPLKNNTVPGQFSEWFDGESLVNRGLRLSPWEPPRLLWAAVEGLCGARPGPQGYAVCPIRPPDWRWMALRRMPCHDGYLTFFVAFDDGHMHIYANRQVSTDHELHVAGDDVTNRVAVRDFRVHRTVFDLNGDITLCLGSDADTYVTAPVTITGLLDPAKTYRARIYSRGAGWVEIGTRVGSELCEMAVSIEDGGFRIITLTPE